jgi:DNA-binding FrmR family transcriptional regulator
MKPKKEENMEHCENCKEKLRDEGERKALVNRLSRIEGQVRGIKNMVENNAYCTDILVQVSAITSALNSFNKELLAEHIRTCVADDVRAGGSALVEELVTTLQKLMK